MKVGSGRDEGRARSGRGEGVVGTRVGRGRGEVRVRLVFVEDRFQAAQRVKRL